MSNTKHTGRDSFGSRLGFILVSAGCAIGIGNVWKFPYLCGQFGGAAFILIYLVFLLILGIPVMIAEFGIGRASRRSAARAFEALEQPSGRWHHYKWISIIGCYMLMMFYTTVAGWLLAYCWKMIKGEFAGATTEQITVTFGNLLSETGNMTFWMILVCVIGTIICYFGLQGGVEAVSKVMMSILLILMVILAVHSVFLKGAGEGIRFYLIPDFGNIRAIGWGTVIFQAMSQAFFTLSIGVGALLIFGSYIGNDRRLGGEALTVASLDTLVALMAGFIIIPACFAFGIEPDAGPSLIFLTIPNLFSQMVGGRIWGSLFFIFLSFAALSTVIAVFENLIAFSMDGLGWSRKKSVLYLGPMIIVLSLPCVFGFNIWAGFEPLGAGSSVLDLEDFILSNNLLPLGSLAFVLFCTRKRGWGWENFVAEANKGSGMKLPHAIRFYMTYILPVIIIVIYLKGYYDMFAPMGTKVLIPWMGFSLLLVAFVFLCTIPKRRKHAAD